MSFAAGASLVGAESILALTPVAVKKTPLDPISAIWSRILVSGGLGWLLTGDRSLPQKEWATATALGHTNLLHVASSYESFRHLPAGQAMSLLYTYPMWNLVFAALFGGESVTARDFGVIGVALVGSLLLNTDPGAVAESKIGRKPNKTWGVIMGLVMALTESAMHTLLRGIGWRDPAKSVWVVNGSASAWLAAAMGLDWLSDGQIGGGHLSTAATWLDAFWLTVFHGISMFSGYWLRFFAVPRLSVMTYSILSYAGLLASYVFGMLFLGERPGWISLLGAAIIIASGVLLQTLPSQEA
jgi:drug/metabolite transporter (DMT)-like permease